MEPHQIEDDLMECVITGFRSPRSLRASPKKSSLFTSPRKTNIVQVENPPTIDESSVDIYGDLSIDYIPIDVETVDGKNTTVTDTTQGDAQTSESMDIFTDILVSDLTEKEKLQRKIKDLEEVNKKLISENHKLQDSKEQAAKNISSFILTARLELQQKDKEINRLRKLLKDLRQQTSQSGVSQHIYQDVASKQNLSRCSERSFNSDSPSSSRSLKSHQDKRWNSKRDRSLGAKDRDSDRNVRKDIRYSIESMADSQQKSEEERYKALHVHEGDSAKKFTRDRKNSLTGPEKGGEERTRKDSDRSSAEFEMGHRRSNRERNRTGKGLEKFSRKRDISDIRKKEDKLSTPESEKLSHILPSSNRPAHSTSLSSRSSSRDRDDRSGSYRSDRSRCRRSSVSPLDGNRGRCSHTDTSNINKNNNVSEMGEDRRSPCLDKTDQPHGEIKSLDKDDLRTKLLMRRQYKVEKVKGSDRVVSSQNTARNRSKEGVHDRENQLKKIMDKRLENLDNNKSNAGEIGVKDKKQSDEKDIEQEVETESAKNKKKEVFVKETDLVEKGPNLNNKDPNKFKTVSVISVDKRGICEKDIEVTKDPKGQKNLMDDDDKKKEENKGADVREKLSSNFEVAKANAKSTQMESGRKGSTACESNPHGSHLTQCNLAPISKAPPNQEMNPRDIGDSVAVEISEMRAASHGDKFLEGGTFIADNSERNSEKSTIKESNINRDHFSEATKSSESSHLKQVTTEINLKSSLSLSTVNEGKFMKTVEGGSIHDQSSDNDQVLVISEDVSFHEENSSEVPPTPHTDSSQPVIKANDCFSGYKDKLRDNPQQQRSNLNSFPITSVGTSLTSATISSQDVSSVAPNASLPFANLTEETNNAYLQKGTFSHYPPSPSNQTFPFKITDVSHSSVAQNSSLSSSSTSFNQSDTRQKSPKVKQSKNESGKPKKGDERAFPITDLLSDNTGSLSQSRLPIPTIISSKEKNDLDTLHANLISSESSSEKSSSQGTATNSSESNSHPENGSNSNGLSADGNGCQATNDYHGLVPEQSLADDANLTPPRIRKRNPSSTPSKLRQSLFSPTTGRSPDVMCTPNLIVLGDEEATSGTLISPCKPLHTPSEFYPPGVRMNIQEVSTHRHIRGEPELLHGTSNDIPGQSPTLLKDAVIGEQCSSESSSAYITHHDITENSNGQGGSSESVSNEMAESEKGEGRSVYKENAREQSSSVELMELASTPETGTKEDTRKNKDAMLSIVKDAFERVFKKNYEAFKAEMAEKAVKDKQLLRSLLEQSFGSFRRSHQERGRKVQAKGSHSPTKAQNTVFTGPARQERQGKKRLPMNDSVKKKKKDHICSVAEKVSVNENNQNSCLISMDVGGVGASSGACETRCISQCAQAGSLPCHCGQVCTGLCAIDSPSLEETRVDSTPSVVSSQSKDSLSCSCSASSPQKELSCFRFYLFPGVVSKSHHLPSTSKQNDSSHKTVSSIGYREESSKSSVFPSQSRRNSEDRLIHEIVSSLDTSWQEAIDKDFRETSILHSQLSLPSSQSAFSSNPQAIQSKTSDRDLSFAGKIPSSVDNSPAEEVLLVPRGQSSETTKTSSSAIIKSSSKPRNDSPACYLNGDREKHSSRNQSVRVEAGRNTKNTYPDACMVTSSDIGRGDTTEAPLGTSTISSFVTQEPDSTSESFPYSAHQSTNQQQNSLNGKTLGQRHNDAVFVNEQECNRPDLPDSPQRELSVKRKIEVSNIPKSSRRRILRGGDQTSLPRGSLISLKNQLFPEDKSDDSSMSPSKAELRCKSHEHDNTKSFLKSSLSNADKTTEPGQDKPGKSPGNTLPSESHHTKSKHTGGSMLNTTFTIHETLSDEDGHSASDHDSDAVSHAEANSGNDSYLSLPSDEDAPSVEARRRYLLPPPSQAIDELSLDAKSLSEFDHDILFNRAKQMRALHASSRTASFSSLLSVGYDSPMSVSPFRFSTPASQGSPGDALLSPSECRVFDSCDEGPAEGFDDVSSASASKPVRDHRKVSEKTVYSNASLKGAVLSRHIPYHDLKKLKLAKSRKPALSDSECDDLPATAKSKSLQTVPEMEGQVLHKQAERLSVTHKMDKELLPPQCSSDGEFHSPRKRIKTTETNLYRRRETPVTKSVKYQVQERKDQQYYSHMSGCQVSRNNYFESPENLLKSRQNYRSLSESSYSSDEYIGEGDAHRPMKFNSEMSPKAGEFYSNTHHTHRNSREASVSSRKSVEIAELLPMEYITVWSPSKPDNPMLKRLSGSPYASRQSPLHNLSSPCSSTKSDPTKSSEVREVSRNSRLLSSSGRSRDRDQISDSPRQRGEKISLKGSTKMKTKPASALPEVDQEVLSWAIAHRKNVNKVRMRLDTRLEQSNLEVQSDGQKESHPLGAGEPQRASTLQCTSNFRKSTPEPSQCPPDMVCEEGQTVVSDVSSHDGQGEELEDGEICDESDSDDAVDDDDDTLVAHDDDKENGLSDEEEEVTYSDMKSSHKRTVRNPSEEERPASRSSTSSRHRGESEAPKADKPKPMPSRRQKNFVRKSDSGHKTSLLDQAHYPSPTKKPAYSTGTEFLDDLSDERGRKRRRSPSPETVGTSKYDSPVCGAERGRRDSMRDRENRRSISFESDEDIDERGKRRQRGCFRDIDDRRRGRRQDGSSNLNPRNYRDCRNARTSSGCNKVRGSRERECAGSRTSSDRNYRLDRRKSGVDSRGSNSRIPNRSRSHREKSSPSPRDRR